MCTWRGVHGALCARGAYAMTCGAWGGVRMGFGMGWQCGAWGWGLGVAWCVAVVVCGDMRVGGWVCVGCEGGVIVYCDV